ncbi:hypothetical protein C8F01DRAFT_511640 [Mycena amicta]|nr:hypothetical protein C8F01DRAFT_511640 [Mycena amicta]
MTSPYTNNNIYEQQRDIDHGQNPGTGTGTGAGRTQYDDYGVSQTGGGAGQTATSTFGTSAMDANSGPGNSGGIDAGSGADARAHPRFDTRANDGVGSGTGAGTNPTLSDAYGTGAGAENYHATATSTQHPIHQEDTTTPQTYGTGKPSVGDKIVGGAEKLAGSMTKNPGLKEKGIERKQGGTEADRTNF